MTPRAARALLTGAILALAGALLALAGCDTGDRLAGRIDPVFADLAHPGSPGCAVGVVRDGRLVFARGYGQASLEHGTSIRPDTVFDIASVSKQFTAAAVALLALEGRLSLDDDIRTHVPDLPDHGRPVTLRQLLHHTGGLRDYLDLLILSGWGERDVSTAADALAALRRQRGVNFAPGDDHLYCNSGYFLMSEVVRHVTGRTLSEFAAERLFRPLGMASTQFLGDQTVPVPRRATGYSHAPDGSFRIDMSQYEQTGDGAVLTTVEDLARWAANFEEPRVGGRALVDLLEGPGRLNDGTPLDYALGLVVDAFRGVRRVRHGGSWAGYRAELARYPDERTGVICLCNRSDGAPRRRAEQVAAILLEDRMAGEQEGVAGRDAATAQGAGSLALPADLAGDYRNPGTGEVLAIRVADGKAELVEWGSASAIVVKDERHLAVPEWEYAITAERGAADAAVHLSIAGRSARPDRFERYSPATPDAGLLREYAGAYKSAELDAVLRLAVEEGRLVLRLPRRAEPQPLRPTVRDSFAGDEVILVFQRDPRGRIGGFRLGTAGARGLWIVREAAHPGA